MVKQISSLKFHPQIFAYATVLVAFFLRAYRLADKNVWWDEGWSVWLSQKDLAWIAFRTAADEHPPLHYWLLHFWNFIAGTDAFAGRFVSLFFGVLTIALLYRIGKRVGSATRHAKRERSKESSLHNDETLHGVYAERSERAQSDKGAWIGVLAALFLGVARFHIWWSQDIKNYTPSIFFAFAALWFALTLISDFTRSVQISNFKLHHSPFAIRYSLFAYALCAALAMWTHYLAALVLIALNLYAVALFTFYVLRFGFASAIRNLPSAILSWFGANLLAAILFAPWMYLYLQNAATWAAAPTFDFGLFLKLVATVLPLGVTTNIDNYAALTVAFTAIAAIPVISILYSVFRKKMAYSEYWTLNTVYCSLFTLIVIFPPILIYILSLTPVSFFAPKIQARYLLILLPAYTMLLALGVALLSRLSRYFAAFAILIVISASIFVLNDYYAERRLTDEYATLVNTVNSFAQPGDAVLLDTDQEWPTFLYYLRAPLDWIGAPNGKPMDDGAADVLVRRALNRYSSVWLVTIPDALATDPKKLLESKLANQLNKQYERTIGDKRLTLYAPTQRNFVAVARENFEPQYPRSDQIDMDTQLIGFDLPTREFNAGDTLRLVTYWHATNPAMVSVRLSNLLSTIIQMPSGDLLRYETDFAIPPDASGDFAITLNQLELARVNIAPRKTFVSAGNISHATDYRFGDSIRLVGYDLPVTNYHATENVRVNLYWRTDDAVEKSYTAFVHIVGDQWNPASNSPLWGQVDRVPTPPITAWLPNETVSDAYVVKIDPNAPPGKYKIEIGLYDAATGTRLPTENGDSVMIAEIEITP
ncbi:MAG: glycosyltransferase family 39 protein [Chloroflexi bacterium]|nr:glycosyltransferase family 39 protein [Chloroflexota bacterium]